MVGRPRRESSHCDGAVSALCQERLRSGRPQSDASRLFLPNPRPPLVHTFLPPNRKRDAGRVPGDAVGSGTRESYLRLRVGGLEVLVLSDPPPFLNTGSRGVGGVGVAQVE